MQVRHKFRTERLSDGERQARVLDASKVLRMVSPATRRTGQSSSRLVVRDGQLVPVDSVSSDERGSRHLFRDQRVTSDQMERHHRLLRRQHFMDR